MDIGALRAIGDLLVAAEDTLEVLVQEVDVESSG